MSWVLTAAIFYYLLVQFKYKSNVASDWFLIAWYFCTFSMVELNLFDFPTEDSALSVTEVETSYIINWTCIELSRNVIDCIRITEWDNYK